MSHVWYIRELRFIFFLMAETLGILDWNAILVRSLKIWGPQSESGDTFASFVTLTVQRSITCVSVRILTTGIAVQEHQQHVHGICDCQMCVLDTQKKRFLRYFANFTYLLLCRRSKHTPSERIPHWENSYASVNGCESATGKTIKYFHIWILGQRLLSYFTNCKWNIILKTTRTTKKESKISLAG